MFESYFGNGDGIQLEQFGIFQHPFRAKGDNTTFCVSPSLSTMFVQDQYSNVFHTSIPPIERYQDATPIIHSHTTNDCNATSCNACRYGPNTFSLPQVTRC